ncbi:MAG: hypothetical protein LBM68_02935 [Bacteroidales bacterium]|jgi:hypothetical protein|nr:hypothetical protein [Bacteroidales bacterium]
MSTILVEIDVSRPAGRKLANDIRKKRCVNFAPTAPLGVTSYSHEEVWRKFEEKFNAHYGTNHKFDI